MKKVDIKTDAAVENNGTSFFNKDALIFSGIAFAMFLVIRFLFPIPDFITDSRGYILGAIMDSDIGYRPMGISVLLKKVHDIDPSISAVAYAQFFLFLFSSLAFIHAVALSYPFSNKGRKWLYGLVLLSPVLLHLCNYVISDSLFISLNMTMLAFLVYLMRKPNWFFLGGVLLFLWLSLFVRYNALGYPFVISICLLILVKHKAIKWVGIAASLGVGLLFYNNIAGKMEEQTSYRVLSGFSGWQMGNNAMLAYKSLDKRSIETDDKDLLLIDSMCQLYIDSMTKAVPNYRHTMETDIMWDAHAPFKQFETMLRIRNRTEDPFTNWIATSLILDKYGKTIIKKYPGAFLTHYLMPNALSFMHPKLEVLEHYYAPETKMFPAIKEWYGLPDNVTTDNLNVPATYNTVSQWWYTLAQIGFIFGMIIFFMNKKKWNVPQGGVNIVVLVFVFWLGKMGFDVLASPVWFRYLAILIPLLSTGVLLMWEQYSAYKNTTSRKVA